MSSADGIRVEGPINDRYGEVLTEDALAFLAGLHRAFDARRRELVAARTARYEDIAAGGQPRLPARDQGRPRGRRLAGRADPRPAWSTAASRSPARPTAR